MSKSEYFQDFADKMIVPSNSIDQTLSISMYGYSKTEKSSENQSTGCFSMIPSLKRKRRIAIRSRFTRIDSLRRLTWNKTSPKQLELAERKIFESVKTQFDGRYISVLNNTQKIWTIYSNLTSKNIPIVLLHGFVGGVGLWSLNLDQLSLDRPIYAIDLPGFARSSRPIFSLDPIQAEKQFIDMLEEWRIEVGLNEEFILLGHSFGGFLSTSYALHYPKYVKQLLLIDPWGFSKRPKDIWQTGRLQSVPTWLRPFSSIMVKLSPMTALRAAGPLGISVIKYVRSDLRVKFETLFDDDRILIYLYHCNTQLPTGEQAFRTMSDCFAWAKEPMIKRIHLLTEQIPIYFLHGERSWITNESSLSIQKQRSNVFVDTIKEAGHHIYADTPKEFHMYLKRILVNKNS